MAKRDKEISAGSVRPPARKRNGAAARKPRRLPVLAGPRSQVPCLSCGLCCTYVAVEIDDPSTLRGATDILWYLYHQGAAVYYDGDEWLVQFESTCRHLQDDRRCGIYETRPQICREFDEKSCEVNADELGTTFYEVSEFLGWLEQNNKRIHTLVRKRFLPDEAVLRGPSVARPQPAFRPRFEALRVLGAIPPRTRSSRPRAR